MALLVAFLSACGGGQSISLAESSDAVVIGNRQGVSPFISLVALQGTKLNDLSEIHYKVASKPGAASRPVSVRYSLEALNRRGYLETGSATLPVFGLYSGYTNHVDVTLVFKDSSSKTLSLDIASATYVDPNQTYDRPTILKKRVAGNMLGFDYFFIKSDLGGPLIVDTDGEIRWAVPKLESSFSTALKDNVLVIGQQTSTQIIYLELDGTSRLGSVNSSTYTNFHHNLDQGKVGQLGEFDANRNGVKSLESTISEFDDSGTVIKEWDIADLLSSYMRNHGDDPSTFIRPGVDWFHSNAATYDPQDDTLIVSIRENFVIKMDYRTGEIAWIFGDPTKYWNTFPSLRAKALQLQPGGLYPIGQHALSITSDGLLMLFNDGTGSFQQPPGAPAGIVENIAPYRPTLWIP